MADNDPKRSLTMGEIEDAQREGRATAAMQQALQRLAAAARPDLSTLGAAVQRMAAHASKPLGDMSFEGATRNHSGKTRGLTMAERRELFQSAQSSERALSLSPSPSHMLLEELRETNRRLARMETLLERLAERFEA